ILKVAGDPSDLLAPPSQHRCGSRTTLIEVAVLSAMAVILACHALKGAWLRAALVHHLFHAQLDQRRQPPHEGSVTGGGTSGPLLRLAELLAAVSLATDLAHDAPLESALRDAVVALGFARR